MNTSPKMNHVLLISLMISLIGFGVLSLSQPASANPNILGTWGATYPNSNSNSANCQLCHLNAGGGNGWNAYGWRIRQGVVDQGLSIADALAAIETSDADGDGSTNLEEITANSQPGWTAGAVNTIHFRDGSTLENQSPPSAITLLDPTATVTPTVTVTVTPTPTTTLTPTPTPPGLSNPITTVITSTNSIEIMLTPIAEGLVSPLAGVATASQPQFLFVVDQPGFVWKIDLISGTKSIFLDLSASLVPLGAFGNFDERGLLGFAIHPNYADNGFVYTYSSEPITGTADFSTMPDNVEANHHAVIAQWQVDNPTDLDSVVNPTSKKVLLRIDQPQFNHNGGHLAFGPDGLLYISLGDGGGADDVDGQPFIDQPMVGHGTGNGQDATNPLGTILRIDPVGTNSNNGQYGIPADNPFIGNDDTRLDEIFAYGFRNVFRFSFDRQTGDLYAGDVGQNDIEEIDIVTAGNNYGWNLKEGSFFFNPNGNDDGFVTDVDPGGLPTNLIDPIAEYDHDEGLSVIGGFVYRGTAMPSLNSTYIFGDWSQNFSLPQGRLFYLRSDNSIAEFQLTDMTALELFLHGFGEDANGELYVLGNTTGNPFPDDSQTNTGVVWRIDMPTTYSLYLPMIIK